jgi:hypothetical protein
MNGKASLNGQADLGAPQNVDRLHHRQTTSNIAAEASVDFHSFFTRYISFN